LRRLAAIGIDMDDVGLTLENNGLAAFHESFQHMLGSLDDKIHRLSRR
jgi:transaldolase